MHACLAPVCRTPYYYYPSHNLFSRYNLFPNKNTLTHPPKSWITLEQGKTTADAMGDVWRGLEVVEAATRVGSEMLVRTFNIHP